MELLTLEPEMLAKQMQDASRKLLDEKIDCTAFLVWFIEQYPHSAEETRKADAKFWEKFR